MNVKLISVTKPCIEGINTAEELISYCARVSSPSNQLNIETAPKLIRYLIEHKHWSPFEMCHATVEIVTSRAIAQQILRHRSFAFSESSQRYSSLTSLEDMGWRLQGKTNRQVGDKEYHLSVEDQEIINNTLKSNVDLYNSLIKLGVAKECARMVLPLCTKTTMYMSGTIRSFIHYIELRTKEDTQKEHRDVATNIKTILAKEFPVISEVLKW